MPATVDDTFTCAMCKQKFKKTRPEEEAVKELERVFGPVPVEKCRVVCDDCYKIAVQGIFGHGENVSYSRRYGSEWSMGEED